MPTIIGVFVSPRSAQRATIMLRDGGLKLGDLVIISRSTANDVTVRHSNAVSLGSGAAFGVVWGSIVGVGWLALGGMAPFIAAGALRVIGAALIGAVLGALLGCLAVALRQAYGRARSEPQDYAGMAESNKTLVAVQVRPGDARRAERTLTKAGAESVRAAEARAPAEAGADESKRRDDESA